VFRQCRYMKTKTLLTNLILIFFNVLCLTRTPIRVESLECNPFRVLDSFWSEINFGTPVNYNVMLILLLHDWCVDRKKNTWWRMRGMQKTTVRRQKGKRSTAGNQSVCRVVYHCQEIQNFWWCHCSWTKQAHTACACAAMRSRSGI